MGINGSMLACIHSFLSKRSFQVRLGPTLSLIRHTIKHNPQENILSPTLPSLIVNDLPHDTRLPLASAYMWMFFLLLIRFVWPIQLTKRCKNSLKKPRLFG